ncbi:hepatic and glial cell adhesion molecule-like [Hyperolius riggenbachi]|uniref:hepatic and glial cell adhesion molecule-like n=1 Tax=Hyperolius riggenbachi TaxID=752182 RepID=UPI0035A30B94
MGRSPEGFRHRWAGPAVAFSFPGSGRGVTSSRGRVMASGGPGPRASPRSTAVTALLLLLLLAAACQGQGDTNAVVGGNITLVAKFTGTPTEINWKVNGDKYVDMELIPPQPPTFYRNRDRSSIQQNGSLTITGLNKTDAGDYKAEALIDNRFQETDYKLTVYERLSKPTINDSSTKEEIIVTCKSAESDVTSYEWLNSTGARVSSKPTYVTLRLKKDLTLTCVIKNPASENRTSITIHPIPVRIRWIMAVVFVVLLVIFLALFALWYLNHLDKICCCFGPPGENCAVKGIDAMFRTLTCGKVNPRHGVPDGQDKEAQQGNADGNKTRREETRPLNAEGNADGKETRRGEDPAPNAKETPAANKNEKIETDQEDQ